VRSSQFVGRHFIVKSVPIPVHARLTCSDCRDRWLAAPTVAIDDLVYAFERELDLEAHQPHQPSAASTNPQIGIAKWVVPSSVFRRKPT